jgi:hypothetical protein
LTINRVIAYLGVDGGRFTSGKMGINDLHLALHRGSLAPSFFNQERFKIGGIDWKSSRYGETVGLRYFCENVPS